MITVNVATLKERLSHYLKLVRAGEEVVVTSHRHRIARVLPVSTPGSVPAPPSRPVSDLRRIKGIKLKRSVSAVAMLVDDRRRR